MWNDEQIKDMEGRTRLCPYYAITGNQVKLISILTTICPSNKKVIHGMKDAIIIPAFRN